LLGQARHPQQQQDACGDQPRAVLEQGLAVRSFSLLFYLHDSLS
jgi:hypothetical protein